MKDHLRRMARYNQWANRRLYGAADLPDPLLRRDVGVYFGSLYLTLEHLLKTDWAWTHLLHGGTLADMPNTPLPADFAALQAARAVQDALLVDWLDDVDPVWLDEPFVFQSALGSWQGLSWVDSRAATFTHLFNHQSHHRGAGAYGAVAAGHRSARARHAGPGNAGRVTAVSRGWCL